MTNVGELLLPILLRTSCAAIAVMAITRLLLWAFAIRSPVMIRLACVLVLLQGWIIAPLVLAVPWYDPPAQAKQVDAAVETGAPLAAPWNVSRSRMPDLKGRFAAEGPVPPARIWNAALAQRSLLAAWLLGMGVLAVGFLRNYVYHLRAISRSAAPDKMLLADWRQLLEATGGPRQLPLRLTDSLGPMLCLLPRGYEVWVPHLFWRTSTRLERQAILRHELSHYRRGDIWKTWLTYLLALPQWFNPAAWWAIRSFQEAGEWLCDLEATSEPENRSDYLQALLRLVELQPAKNLAAGHCAHAHPLLVRVRRLLSPSHCKESLMNRILFLGATLLVALLPLVRLELVARAAPPPTSVQAVKDRMDELDNRLGEVKNSIAALKERGEKLKSAVASKVDELNELARNEGRASDELKRRAKLYMTNTEASQLEALADLDKLASQDERVLLLGRAAKDSSNEAVRRKALAAAAALKEAGYPAIALCYEGLNDKDRGFLAQELNKHKSDDRFLFFALMAKGADNELLKTLLNLDLEGSQRLTLIGAIAEAKIEENGFVEQALAIGDKTPGDDGVLILYAFAKGGSGKHAAEAVKLAVKRKEAALPILAAAYKKEEKESRAAVVKAAKQLGGEAADFIVQKALEDPNEELRAAAEAAAK